MGAKTDKSEGAAESKTAGGFGEKSVRRLALRREVCYNILNPARFPDSVRFPAVVRRWWTVKLDPEVRGELFKMARDCLILSLVMALGFLVFGKLNLAAVWGLLIGYALAVGNFFFLSVGVTRALDTGDEAAAKRVMLASRTARTVVLLGVMGVCVWIWTQSERIHWLPVVAAAFYPRIVIAARGLFAWYAHKKDPAPAQTERTEEPEEPEEETEDEFEKFVGHFSKGPVPGEEQAKNQDKQSGDASSHSIRKKQ